ncbi:MAG: DUF2188 domain-containing protein [Phycisphaerales bacterium]
MGKKNVIVGPQSGGGWKVTVGATKVSNHRTQQAAINAAKPIARGQRSELSIQGENGKVREKFSYGPDPHPPRG